MSSSGSLVEGRYYIIQLLCMYTDTYMVHTCYIHGTYMVHTCFIDGTYMFHRWYIHVSYNTISVFVSLVVDSWLTENQLEIRLRMMPSNKSDSLIKFYFALSTVCARERERERKRAR